MKIYRELGDFCSIVDVYYAVLPDGTIAMKFSLESDFVQFATVTEFKNMIHLAPEKEKALRDVEFALQPGNVSLTKISGNIGSKSKEGSA